MAEQVLDIADKTTLDNISALLTDTNTGLSAIKQLVSQEATSSTYIRNPPVREVSIGTQVSQSTLPYEFARGSVLVYNDEIHILGSSISPGNQHYKWDSIEWTEVSTLPYEFYLGAAVVFHNEIHLLGGANSLTSHYKWDGTSWTSVSTLPYEFTYGGAVVYNDEIHILGGGEDSYYRLHYKWDGTSWTEVSTLPYEFSNGCVVICDGLINIMGSGPDTHTVHYIWVDGSWSSNIILPYNFYNGSAVVYKDTIHILGGRYSNTSTYHYKLVNNTDWESVAALPYDFYYGSAVVYKDEIHILGDRYETTAYTSHYTVYASYYEYGTTLTLNVGNVVRCDKNNVFPLDDTMCIEVDNGWKCMIAGDCQFVVNNHCFIVTSS